MVHFKEIGGNFPLNSPLNGWDNHCVIQRKSPFFFSSGRSAILAMIRLSKAECKKVALPYFTCESVIEPFLNRGCQIVFYPIEINLKVNEESIIEFCNKEQPYLFYYHDYFGLNEEVKWMNIFDVFHQRLIFVNDQTHSYFHKKKCIHSHYALMSIRKWGGISEGGILAVNQGEDQAVTYDERPTSDERLKSYFEASRLKLAYLSGDRDVKKDSFRKLFYYSESFFDAEDGIFPIHQNAMFYWFDLIQSDFAEKRRNNFQTLEWGWMKMWNTWAEPALELTDEITPLYFPILVKVERQILQTFLAGREVYAPIIWPKSKLIQEKGDDNLYERLLCIPIDQRYGGKEMNGILEIFEEFHLTIIDERN
jgi:hypothetical protein